MTIFKLFSFSELLYNPVFYLKKDHRMSIADNHNGEAHGFISASDFTIVGKNCNTRSYIKYRVDLGQSLRHWQNVGSTFQTRSGTKWSFSYCPTETDEFSGDTSFVLSFNRRSLYVTWDIMLPLDILNIIFTFLYCRCLYSKFSFF